MSMSTTSIDFAAINQAALANPTYIESLLPDAHYEGVEGNRRLHCGTLSGGAGRSFNLNTETGKWYDQQSGEGGGDVVSLVAAQQGIGQGEAARLIAEDLHLSTPVPAKLERKELPELRSLDWNKPTFRYDYFMPVEGQRPKREFVVLRWEKPGFKKAVRRSLGTGPDGAYIKHAKGAELIPYNLVGSALEPRVDRSQFVVIVEGENKVDRLLKLGICASCNPGGAGKWEAGYNHWFEGKDIVILPDNDEPGRKHAEDVARNLHGVAASVKVCELPGLPEKGDVVDWLEMPGNDKERLQALMNDAPYWVKELEDSPEDTSLDILPSPPVVPLEAFRPAMQDLITEAAAAFTVPSQIPAACLLSIVSALVGRTRAVEAKKGWLEHANTWIVIVANSGDGKSPVAKAFMRPIEEIEVRLFKKWKEDYEAYTLALSDFNKAKCGEPPVVPYRTQFYLNDATLESLADALDQNPRGILWQTDELVGMLADFDKYNASGKGGSTKARLLSSYDCGAWKSNRRDVARNLLIPAACVSIFGGIQPGMMPRVFDGADKDSGFLPRFMFIRAEREAPALWSETTLSNNSQILLRKITERLAAFKLRTPDTGGTEPSVVPLTKEAKAAYVEWYNALALEGWAVLNDEASDSICQKLKSHALRLCLLLHCLDAAFDGTDGLNPIPEETMRRALLLAEWVKAHQAQVWKLFSTKGNTKAARAGSPVERAIMSAVVADEAQITADNGRIANKRLVELVNSCLPCPVDPRIICRGIGACDLFHWEQ